MTSPRTWLLATFLISAAFVHPALAADKANVDAPAAVVAAPTGHHGQAFAAKQGAKALIVEPDGRVIATDGRSDLIAPASIAERSIQRAIARMIETAARSAPVRDNPGKS